MNYNYILKNKKILLTLIIFILLVVLVIYRWVWENNFAGKLEIIIAPRVANITINGNKISNGIHYVKPGEYEIKAEHGDFVGKSTKFIIKQKEHKTITFALATKDGTDKWYLNNRQDDIIRAGAGYKTIKEGREKLKEESPITEKLPYTDTLNRRFHISYNLKEDGSVNNLNIRISSCYNKNSSVDSEEYRKSSANRWLDQNLEDKEKGKYKIEYSVQPCDGR